MSGQEINNTKDEFGEQKICISCGFCCDGTLFTRASLQAGERGSMPAKIEQNYLRINDKEYFVLPCQYFNGKCSIYIEKKAYVCSAYRCQMLKDFAEYRVTQEQALEIVNKTIRMRRELLDLYYLVSGNNKHLYFRKLLRELGVIMEHSSKETTLSIEYEQLIAKCNIFEALLIKYFRSDQDFNDLIMRQTPEIY